MALWTITGSGMKEMALNTGPEPAWQPIETAPAGEDVLLDHPAWRHPFVGQYTGVDQLVLIDGLGNHAVLTEDIASHWHPLPDRWLQPESRH